MLNRRSVAHPFHFPKESVYKARTCQACSALSVPIASLDGAEGYQSLLRDPVEGLAQGSNFNRVAERGSGAVYGDKGHALVRRLNHHADQLRLRRPVWSCQPAGSPVLVDRGGYNEPDARGVSSHVWWSAQNQNCSPRGADKQEQQLVQYQELNGTLVVEACTGRGHVLPYA